MPSYHFRQRYCKINLTLEEPEPMILAINTSSLSIKEVIFIFIMIAWFVLFLAEEILYSITARLQTTSPY